VPFFQESRAVLGLKTASPQEVNFGLDRAKLAQPLIASGNGGRKPGVSAVEFLQPGGNQGEHFRAVADLGGVTAERLNVGFEFVRRGIARKAQRAAQVFDRRKLRLGAGGGGGGQRVPFLAGLCAIGVGSRGNLLG
jgi:hypothetical protein